MPRQSIISQKPNRCKSHGYVALCAATSQLFPSIKSSDVEWRPDPPKTTHTEPSVETPGDTSLEVLWWHNTNLGLEQPSFNLPGDDLGLPPVLGVQERYCAPSPDITEDDYVSPRTWLREILETDSDDISSSVGNDWESRVSPREHRKVPLQITSCLLSMCAKSVSSLASEVSLQVVSAVKRSLL
eukprot:Blabericola_migrator_1__13340@NODE_940_length_5959_cov_113_267312_g652_i0_p4_GENE_NODE_940_length_5959_cov_113_267312_g652_i0NODE_940_length_5959_cov_113_267312_g652_i0_p4_ORF_typecomplete_len185_score23_28_NODE_940_length_5959_cov_113_267312_g652_i036054159